MTKRNEVQIFGRGRSTTRRAWLPLLMVLAWAMALAEPASAQTLAGALEPVTNILAEAVALGENVYMRLIISIVIIVGAILFAIFKGRRGSAYVIFGVVGVIVYNVGISVLGVILP